MSDFTRVATAHELLHGRAMSLKFEHHGVLRVTSGRLWITSNHTQEDYFLEAGDTFEVPSGAHVVAETWNQNKAGSAEFTFQHPPSPSQTSAACQSPLAQVE
jgi:hypothetical protein